MVTKLRRKNNLFFKVTNNFFSPIINFGDYIAVIPKAFDESLNNKLCYIKQGFEIVVGIFFYNDSVLKSHSSNIIKLNINPSEEIGEVICIHKRY